VKFVQRDENNDMILDYFGETKNYALLNVIEFNSTRKRMSVIIRDPET